MIFVLVLYIPTYSKHFCYCIFPIYSLAIHPQTKIEKQKLASKITMYILKPFVGRHPPLWFNNGVQLFLLIRIIQRYIQITTIWFKHLKKILQEKIFQLKWVVAKVKPQYNEQMLLYACMEHTRENGREEKRTTKKTLFELV